MFLSSYSVLQQIATGYIFLDSTLKLDTKYSENVFEITLNIAI